LKGPLPAAVAECTILGAHGDVGRGAGFAVSRRFVERLVHQRLKGAFGGFHLADTLEQLAAGARR
jgi:hypothetical protein